MRSIRLRLATAALCLGVGLLAACGGGSGGGSTTEPSPPETSRNLSLLATNLPDQTVAMPTSATWLFDFDAAVAADGLAAQVELRDSQGAVPVVADVFLGSLRVRTAQPLRMRTDHTLTIRTGLKASTGAVLRADVVRRFRTVLLDGVAQVVQPGNNALTNYAGRHTFRIGDLNGDGRPDIVQIGGDEALLYQGNSFAVNVLLQNADHSFTRAQNLLVHESQHAYSNSMGEIGIIDLDHDGRPEIVIGIQRPLPGLNGLIVLKQDAQGRYAVAGFIATDFAYRLFIADIDRDGKPDLLAIGQGLAMTDGPDRCGLVAVLSSPAGARLQPPTVLPCGGYEAVVGTLERPDRIQLVLLRAPASVPAQPFLPRLAIYDLNAQGQPTLSNTLMAAAAPVCAGLIDCYGLMLLDINGDGVQDLLFRAALITDRSVTSVVYTRSGQGAYAEFLRQDFGNNAFAYMTADMDRDGLDDIMVVVQGDSGSFVAGGYAQRTPGLELSHKVPVVAFDTMRQDTVGIADMDGDGLPDVVLDSYNSGVSVMFQKRP